MVFFLGVSFSILKTHTYAKYNNAKIFFYCLHFLLYHIKVYMHILEKMLNNLVKVVIQYDL